MRLHNKSQETCISSLDGSVPQKDIFSYILILFPSIFIIPSYDSTREYKLTPDTAWLLHPLFCVTVPVLYAYITIQQYFIRTFRN